MAFKLAAKIDLNHAPETEEERLTVRQLKTALNQLGYYTPDPRTGMNDDIDEGFKDSIYAYQRKNTIFHDDTDLGPKSTTERLLADDLEYSERDHLFTGTYIWRTVGDEKVRGQHAMRNGQTYLWSEPPEGGHPSEDYNCRCWAEHTNPPYHPWIEWVNERREQRIAQSLTVEKLAEPRGLNTDPLIKEPKLTAGEVATYAASAIGVVLLTRYFGPRIATQIIAIRSARKLAREAAKRNVDWIRNASRAQLQKKFKHAKIFGIKNNPNNKTLDAYKKALEDHVRSPNTIEKSGKLHGEAVTHYYDPKTHLNVIKDSKGNFRSAWELKEKQIEYMNTTGNIGGGKK